ncbi:dihydrolipoamide acetyltransferase family protein [Leifsonia sp. AG29]|uniref:dihydrolipoamide acetyltransferase family protein n=1 Tax=Leifsonia sp. AG29 TaxID=2598860 RepID=UPI00131B9A4A|nr:dihydrolipoamide acetyltransferase family protein [Leifsonia sp. AG29]
MAVKDFALPDLGEGLTESELVSWKVAVGEEVRLNQIIAEVETAKALVELPAPYDGRVSRLYVEPGVTVAVGEPIVAFEVGAPEGATGAGGPEVQEAAPATAAAEAPEPTLVGYGARADSGSRPVRRPRPGLSGPAPDRTPEPALAGSSAPAAVTAPAASVLTAERPLAAPPVRKLARERGIDLATIRGTGERGHITRQDLDRASAPAAVTAPSPGGATAPATLPSAADEVRIPIRGVRKATADAMVRSAAVPQATVFLTVDVTPTMELIGRLRAHPASSEARPGLLAVVGKACTIAIARTPELNSRWDDENQEIVQYRRVHLGIAAATPRGLLVPVVRDAQSLSLADLAVAIRELAETARAGRTAPSALTGGTMTITNVGVFGVDAGTPLLTPGEAAILALGATRRQPWEHDGAIALRDVMTLALSFDHRIVDGEQASRFLADLGRILSDPASVIAMV